MFNNVTKVTSNNFGLVWKMIFYKMIAFLICVGLFLAMVVPVAHPVITDIRETDFFSSLSTVLRQVFSGGYFSDSFAVHLEKLNEDFVKVGVIVANRALNMVFAYALAVLVLLLLRFLFSFTDYAVAYAINENMSSNAKLGFAATVTKTIKPAARFWLAHHLFTVPYDILVGTVLLVMTYYLLPLFSIFTMFFVILTAAFLISLRMTLFSFWMPEIINNGGGIFASLKKSMCLSFENFWKHLGGYIILTMCIIGLSIFLVAYTFGAGLIILLPLITLLIISYVFVSYYTVTRRSYYINYDTIVHPPADLDAEAQNYTIPEEEIQARMEELKKEREKIENQK